MAWGTVASGATVVVGAGVVTVTVGVVSSGTVAVVAVVSSGVVAVVSVVSVVVVFGRSFVEPLLLPPKIEEARSPPADEAPVTSSVPV